MWHLMVQRNLHGHSNNELCVILMDIAPVPVSCRTLELLRQIVLLCIGIDI